MSYTLNLVFSKKIYVLHNKPTFEDAMRVSHKQK
jgi:hypothetical protein